MNIVQRAGLAACAVMLAACLAVTARAETVADPLPEIGSMGVVETGDVLRALQKSRGKVVLLNFWASWCAPCRAERLELMELREVFAPEELVVLGLSVDQDPMAYAKFITDNDFNYPVRRASESVARMFNIGAIPRLVAYAPDGRRALDHEGMVEADELEGAVRALLGK